MITIEVYIPPNTGPSGRGLLRFRWRADRDPDGDALRAMFRLVEGWR